MVADRPIPIFHHVRLLKPFAADGRAAAPAEIIVVFAKVCRSRGVPGRGQRAAESMTLLKEPAKRRNRTDGYIGQRADQMRQPVASRTSIRIAKNKNVISLLRLLHGCAKSVHFFAAPFGTSRDDDGDLALAGSRQV